MDDTPESQRELTSVSTPPYLEAVNSDLVGIPILDRRRAPNGEPKRMLLVPPNIATVLTGVLSIDQSPAPRFAHYITIYQLGYFVKVSLSGLDSESKKPFLERLAGLSEVWVMCFRDPRASQWRLFGRFVRQNCFVGIKLHTRENLGQKENYNAEGENFINLWNKLFSQFGYVLGSQADEYLSEPFGDVDNPTL